MKRRQPAITILAGLLVSMAGAFAALAQQKHPFDENGKLDTVAVETRQLAESQWVAIVTLQNDENLAAMTLPLSWRPHNGHFRLDSASYSGLRTEYFALKTFYPDTIAGTILIGLISNLGTDRPPLEPGSGPIARLHFTSLKNPSENLVVDTAFVRPFNVLQLVTPDVRSILPAFKSNAKK